MKAYPSSPVGGVVQGVHREGKVIYHCIERTHDAIVGIVVITGFVVIVKRGGAGAAGGLFY